MSRDVKVRPVIDEYQYYQAFKLTNTNVKIYGFGQALEKLLKIVEGQK